MSYNDMELAIAHVTTLYLSTKRLIFKICSFF